METGTRRTQRSFPGHVACDTLPPGEDPTAPRRAGVLLPVGSLPDGRLGSAAFAFVDWLADAGQAWWQVLPITPPDRYGSPYASPSAFASWRGYLAAPRAAVSAGAVSDFRERNGYWIDDWARAAGPGALEDQVRVDREWRSLRDHAASRGVRILGDLPFYVAPRGADVRAHPGLFRSDPIAGVPPDAFTADGQLWGNPTYDWAAMRADGYRWWIERLRRSHELFDSLRIDHFRAFVAWWGVPRGARTARSGTLAARARRGGHRRRPRAARRAVAGGRGPGGHHPAGPRADRAPRAARNARASSSPSRAAGATPTASRTTSATPSSTRAPTTTRRRRAGGRRRPRPRVRRRRPPPPPPGSPGSRRTG